MSRHPLLGSRGAAPDRRHEGGRAQQDRARHQLQKVSLEKSLYLDSQKSHYLDSQRIQPRHSRQTAHQTEYDKIPVTDICKIFHRPKIFLFMENIFRLRHLTLTASLLQPRLPQMLALNL